MNSCDGQQRGWLKNEGSNDCSDYFYYYFIQVQLDVEVFFIQDTLKGNDTTEIRVKLKKQLKDAIPAGED